MTETDPALMTAESLLSLYARGRLSPVEAVQAVMSRIERVNPALNAFAVLDERAIAAARESETRWLAGRPMGVLDGVPCTVKDLIDVAGFPTRRGSLTTSDAAVPHDAPLVVGLRSAGAVVVGKTTTTEFGWKSPGDCPLHGVTRNPLSLKHSTGGSSSGAGAAGAACLAPLHVGTDAGGSIRIPAAWCGLVGLKPTYGRIPQWPAGAFSAVACAGPMTRHVRDAALMFSAMARSDARDPLCLPDDPRDWRDGIEDGVAGLSVAVVRRLGFEAPSDATAISAVERAAALLQEAGAHVEQADPEIPDSRAIFGRLWSVALARLVAGLTPDKQALLDDGLREVAAAGGRASGIEVLDGEAARVESGHAMADFMRRYDLILCPTVPAGPPLADLPTERPTEALWRSWAPWTFAFNLTRQPAISVPIGLGSNGLPVAVQVAAALYRDDIVLRAARALERALPPFPVPEIANT
ncbi:MAG TPA: amidase [Acidisphaera sp.]|nr:amidase [Acidisphaera sp.]